MSPRIGGLFFGYGGLDMAVQQVLGGELAWVSEFDKGANKVIAHRYPGVPNLGDITEVDWTQVEPVDVITGGSPCQDLSHAGKRGGMTEGTRSNLWVAMREAIAALRPSLVIWENVRGAASAEATSDLEFCPGCMGDAWYRGPVLRALGRVVGDLADLNYVGGLHGLRAADVGAPHGRFRYFLAAHATGGGRPQRWPEPAGVVGRPDAVERRGATPLLPTPAAYDGDRGGPQHPDKRRDGGHSVTLQDPVHGLLPTPQARDWKGAGPADMNRHDPNLSAIGGLLPQRLLATPTSAVATGGPPQDSRGKRDLRLDVAAPWGQYADAIARWATLTRPAPAPTQPSKKGTPQLSPAFSEWLMGLPDGHVTGVPGLSRNDQLKALGNGVVPQQAAAAIRFLLSVQERAA